MSQTANAQFTIKSWDEKPYGEIPDGPKLTRATVVKTFTGDLDGEGFVEYLMMVRADGTASFVGHERIVATLCGKTGSFVLERTGVFDGGAARETYTVVPGSGTGALAGLRGKGTSAVSHENVYPFTLDYDFE